MRDEIQPLLRIIAERHGGRRLASEEYFVFPKRAISRRGVVFWTIYESFTTLALVSMLESGALCPWKACLQSATNLHIPLIDVIGFAKFINEDYDNLSIPAKSFMCADYYRIQDLIWICGAADIEDFQNRIHDRKPVSLQIAPENLNGLMLHQLKHHLLFDWSDR